MDLEAVVLLSKLHFPPKMKGASPGLSKGKTSTLEKVIISLSRLAQDSTELLKSASTRQNSEDRNAPIAAVENQPITAEYRAFSGDALQVDLIA